MTEPQEVQEPVAIIEHTLGGSIQYCPLGTAYKLPMGVPFNLYTEPQPSPASQGDSLDAARLDWLEADEMNRVFHLGKFWYTRASYGMPYRKRASLREAIDTARAAQEGK